MPTAAALFGDNRVLTRPQHEGLDRMAKREPDARVVGWDRETHSPLIAVPGKPVLQIINASTGFPNGRPQATVKVTTPA